MYTFKIGSVTHLHIKWRAWLNAIGWRQRVGSSWGCWMTSECRSIDAVRHGMATPPGRLRLKAVCVCWHAGRGAGFVRSAVVGAGTGHLPPSRTHAALTNPRLEQTRDRCTRRLFSGEVAGVRGANVGSRETTATATVGPQCLRYWQPAKVHKAAGATCISHRSSWLTAKTSSSSSCYVIDAHVWINMPKVLENRMALWDSCLSRKCDRISR